MSSTLTQARIISKVALALELVSSDKVEISENIDGLLVVTFCREKHFPATYEDLMILLLSLLSEHCAANIVWYTEYSNRIKDANI